MDTDFRVLTPEAFDFVLNNELKRAVRSQNFLTLVFLRAHGHAPSGAPLREVAGIVGREVRETDLLAVGGESSLSMVLLDADLPNSQRVIDRVLSRLEHYQFSIPVDIEVGAACCPTHGVDAGTLRRIAERDAATRRGGERGTANAQ